MRQLTRGLDSLPCLSGYNYGEVTCFQHQRLVNSSGSRRDDRDEGGCVSLTQVGGGEPGGGVLRRSGAERAELSTRSADATGSGRSVGRSVLWIQARLGRFSFVKDGAKIPRPRRLSPARGSERVEPRVRLPDTDTGTFH